jgi:hypothetical protein
VHDDLARACDTIAATPSRVAADPVEFLGTGVGSGGHAGISAGDPGPHPGRPGGVLLQDSEAAAPAGTAAAALSWLLDDDHQAYELTGGLRR